jgi:MFS family permease
MRTNKNTYAFAICALCYLFGGTVATLLSSYLPVAVPELLGRPVSEDELGDIGAWLNAGFLYGWMLGGLILGVVSDSIGRVKSLALSAALYGLATCMVVFSSDWHALLALRFCAGMGVGGVLLVSTVYIAEVWKETSRPIALGVLAVAFPVGIVLTGAMTVWVSHWRQAFWLGVIPSLLALVALIALPESERWLQTKTADHPRVQTFFAPEYRRNLWFGSIIYAAVLIGLWGIFSWLPTWVQGLLQGVSDGQQERGLSMMLLGMGGIAGGTVSGLLIKKLGMRGALLLTFAGLTVACGLLFLTNNRFSTIIYAEIALLSLFFGISQGALSGYIPELFPTPIRATATGFCFNIGRIFTATAVFFVGTLVGAMGGFGPALLLFSIPFLIALVAAFFSPDHHGALVE